MPFFSSLFLYSLFEFTILVLTPSGTPIAAPFSVTGVANSSSLNQTATISGTLFNATNGTGDYKLQITLAESNTSFNAAAGFNEISIQSVPFDFEPSAGTAILGAGFGLNKLRKRIKAKKKTAV